MKLTTKNYYSKSNKAISNSKIRDFLISKELYKSKHIDGGHIDTMTPSMVLGQMVDSIISTGNIKEPLKTYHIKVLKSDNADLYEFQRGLDPQYLVSEDNYNKAVNMAKRILDSDIYAFYKEYHTEFQVPFQTKYHGVPVCGLLDALTVDTDSKTIYIDDFKTANHAAIRSMTTWYWHCVDYGYFRQMAHYRAMVQEAYPDYSIQCRHIVISSSEEHRYPVKIYVLAEEVFAGQIEQFCETVLLIKQEKLWKDPLPTFEESTMLCMPNKTVLESDVDTE